MIKLNINEIKTFIHKHEYRRITLTNLWIFDTFIQAKEIFLKAFVYNTLDLWFYPMCTYDMSTTQTAEQSGLVFTV